MGIQGLLQFLSPVIEKSQHISRFRDKVAAIDAMSWLYRGCYGCAYELHTNTEGATSYLQYIRKMLQLLLYYSVRPIMVFDGRNLPAKERTERLRKEQKDKQKQLGEGFMAQGEQEKAAKHFKRSINVTKKMIYLTIDIMRQLKIDFVVAPYEADAQIAQLVHSGLAQVAISEDSDLVAYGVEEIIFKLQISGECNVLAARKYKDSRELRSALSDGNLRAFLSFTQQQVVDSCVLAGCDYLPSVKGIGIKKAVDLVYRFQNAQTAVRHLRQQKTFRDIIPQDYEKALAKISLIFVHQMIYDCQSKQIRALHPVEAQLADEDVIGVPFAQAEQFACGLLHFKTLEKRELQNVEAIAGKLFSKQAKPEHFAAEEARLKRDAASEKQAQQKKPHQEQDTPPQAQQQIQADQQEGTYLEEQDEDQWQGEALSTPAEDAQFFSGARRGTETSEDINAFLFDLCRELCVEEAPVSVVQEGQMPQLSAAKNGTVESITNNPFQKRKDEVVRDSLDQLPKKSTTTPNKRLDFPPIDNSSSTRDNKKIAQKKLKPAFYQLGGNFSSG